MDFFAKYGNVGVCVVVEKAVKGYWYVPDDEICERLKHSKIKASDLGTLVPDTVKILTDQAHDTRKKYHKFGSSVGAHVKRIRMR